MFHANMKIESNEGYEMKENDQSRLKPLALLIKSSSGLLFSLMLCTNSYALAGSENLTMAFVSPVTGSTTKGSIVYFPASFT